MSIKIVIVDYNMGNVRSVANMLRRIGVTPLISSKISDILSADKIILPGVGSFDTGMGYLQKLGLISPLNQRVLVDKVPLLGICLGMQLLANKSEEGRLPGLGWIDGVIRKFSFKHLQSSRLKVPHMGWNVVDPRKRHVILNNIPEPMRFYFVHSYYYTCDSEDHILAQTEYGCRFISIVHMDNIIGCQFHPEKSHKYGQQMLKNFVELT